ncbi:MAG: metallophosphoesterase [Thermodesulfobacteriota bacterium]
MKILTVSDRVCKELIDPPRKELPSPELILSCGDLPPEYLSTLREKFQVPLYYILGNHDIRYDQSPPVGCTNLGFRLKNHHGLRFLGLSGSRWYNGGANQYGEKEMSFMLRRLWLTLLINRRVDIMFSHTPPRHIGDREDPCHKGFRTFLKLIDKYRPLYFIHGHIHSHFKQAGDRIICHNQTRVINSYGYHFIEIESP